jgi:hypothetical protein
MSEERRVRFTLESRTTQELEMLWQQLETQHSEGNDSRDWVLKIVREILEKRNEKHPTD